MASVSGSSVGWTPVNASDWSYQTVNLDKYATSGNLMIRFRVVTKQGNSVYLDNINLGQFGLSAENMELENVISFYPNPADDVLTIEYTGDQATSLDIKDLSGRSVKSVEVMRGSNSIAVADLTSGMYILEMRFNGYIWTRKLIIN